MFNDQAISEFMQDHLLIGDLNEGDVVSFGKSPEKYIVSDIKVNVAENMIVGFSITSVTE